MNLNVNTYRPVATLIDEKDRDWYQETYTFIYEVINLSPCKWASNCYSLEGYSDWEWFF